MDIDELLSKVDNYGGEDAKRYDPLNEYLDSTDIGKIKRKDLEKIIDKYGQEIFSLMDYDVMKLYQIVLAKESSKTMNRLTWWIFGFTLITTASTLYNIFF